MKKWHQDAVKEFQRLLRQEYGVGLRDVIVFGSVARDTDTAESDLDVMIVLDGTIIPVDWHTEKDIRGIAFEVELKCGVVFDLKVIDQGALREAKGHTPFIERVLAEGVRA